MKKKVSISKKIYGWIIIILLNCWCLFYIFKYSLNLSNECQKAWLFSLLLWLFIEIVFVSTNLVFLNHILIPSLTMKDVNIIKIKMMENFRKYQENYENHHKNGNISG